jgi:tape measure domain-containing protein
VSENVGTISYLVEIDTQGIRSSAQKVESELSNSASKAGKAYDTAITGAVAGAVAALTTKLIGAVGNLTGEMTDMYDASIKFPKVIQSMGGSTDFASKSFNTLRKYADDTIYSLEDMTKTFGTLYAVAGDKAEPLVKALGGVSALASNATQAMDSWSLQLTQMVSKPSVAWQDFRILLEQNPAAISKIAESMGKTSSQIVQDVQNGTLSTEDFLKALQNVGNDPALQKMATDSDNFRNATGQLKASVVSAGQKILEKFGPTLVGMLNNAADSVKRISDNFIGVIDWFNKGGPAVDMVKSLAVAIGTVVTIMTVWSAVTTVATAIQAAFNAVMAANPIGLIILAIAALVAGLIWFFTQTETGKKIWEDFTKFLSEAITNIGNWFKDLWNGIVATFSGIGQWFGDRVNDIKNFFSGIPGAIGGFFKDAWDRVTGIFGKIGEWFSKIDLAQAGTDMINGLVKGISGAKDAVVNKIKEIASGALDAIKKFFGIKSPSKVMAQMGTYMMQGWSIGMDKSSSMAISSAQRASSGVLGTFDNLTSPTLGIDGTGSLVGSGGSRTANITNNYIVNNQADAEIISRKQAYAMGAV